MGRSFWIMDNVSPLRQLAASVTKPTRPRATDSPAGQERLEGRERLDAKGVALASMQTAAAGIAVKPAGQGSLVKAGPPPVRATIKPFDGSSVFLFTPAPMYRMRYSASGGGGRPDVPEYPAMGARIDYYLPSPSSDVKLEILDVTGTVVRSYSSAAPAAAPAGRSGGRRGGGLPSALPTKVGMNRFVWDLRYAGGPATAGDGEGGGFGGGGPIVPPGSYKARLAVGGVTKTETIVVKIDPRVAKDGVTVADLAEQTKLGLKVRDQLADARQLATRVRQGLQQKRGDQAKLQSVLDRLVTKTGPYEDQMFIDQMSNVGREIGQADQKLGASAFERFNQLMKEWAAIKTDAEAALR